MTAPRPATRRPARSTATVVVALSLVIAACGGGSDDDDGADRSSTSTTSSTTTTEPPTTTQAPACPAVSVPAEATEITEVEGDVDGDGTDDELRSYRLGEEWHIQVELAADGGSDVVVDTFGSAAAVVGGADVDGDGRDELWARVGSGASTTIVALAQLVDCELRWVADETGARAEMPVGGSVGTVSGVECGGSVDPEADLTVYVSTLLGEGPEYETVATEHRLEDGRLLALGSQAGSVDATTDEFTRYVRFTCDDLSL